MAAKLGWWVAGSLVVGVVIGRLSGPHEPAGATTSSAEAAHPNRSSGRGGEAAASSGTRFSRLQQEIRGASPDKVPGVLYRALESADPNERSALVGQCLAAMDASNWKTCLDQFTQITRRTGRENYEDWKACLFRTGQVGGEEALNFYKSDGLASQTTQSWQALYGWSSSDPAAARQWIDQLQASAPDQYHRLMPALTAGAALKDPEEGFRLLSTLPEDERQNCVGHFTWNLVQNEGLDRAVSWMKEVSLQAGDAPGPYANAVTSEVLDKVFWSAGNTGGVKELVARMAEINPVVKMDDNRIRQAMGKFHDANSGLNLLAGLSQEPSMREQSESPALVATAVAGAVQRGPAKVADWFAHHPDAPFLEPAAVQACQQLQSRGLTSEVDRVLQALPTDAARSSVSAALGR